MKSWPSTKFFQSLAAGSFLMASYNMINNLRNSGVAAEHDTQLKDIRNLIVNIGSRVDEIAMQRSNGNPAIFKLEKDKLLNELAALKEKYLQMSGVPDLTHEFKTAVDIIGQFHENMSAIELKIQNALAGSRLVEYQVLSTHKAQLIAQRDAALIFINNNIGNHANISQEIFKEISKNISTNKNNFTGDNIWELFEKFNQWLNSMTLQENLAFVNMSGIIFIMITLFSIIMIFYGAKLLDYFQLEKRFPRIAKMIILRRKFQAYYLLTNILLISVVLIIMFALNLAIFIN